MQKYERLFKLFHIVRRFASNQCKKKLSSKELIELADKHIVSTSESTFPIVANKGRGCTINDVEGKEYLDFVSGKVGVVLGHAHPKVSKVVAEQAWQLTNTPRSLNTKVLVDFGQYITDFFCYEKVLNLDSDSDAVDAAITIARKWATKAKGIENCKAKVIIPESKTGKNKTDASESENKDDLLNDGSSTPGFETVPYSDARALEFKLRDPEVCAFLFEPIDTKTGVSVPDPCYLKKVREMCCRHKVLMIADETDCGLGVAGCWLCCSLFGVKPDILILGKALTAGYVPFSVVMSERKIMDLVEPGTLNVNSGTNPIACKASVATLKAIYDEKLVDNAKAMGEMFRECLCDLPRDIVLEVSGIGLLNAIEFVPGISALDICCELLKNGLLVNVVSDSVVRLNPPLTVKDKQISKAVRILRRTIENSRGNCKSEAQKPEPPKKKISESFTGILKCAKKCLSKQESPKKPLKIEKNVKKCEDEKAT